MNPKNTVIRLIFLSILMALALSEPDLCKTPKLNSITFIPGYDIWFFTSDGYYWLLNETDFPPGRPTGKLPQGFSRGDASYYCDLKKVCAKVTKNSNRTQQLLYVVEKLNSGNRVIEFDIENKNWSTSSQAFSTDRIVGRANINGKDSEEIEAIFSLTDTDVYVVKKRNYAAVNWQVLCSDSNGFSKAYDQKSSDALQSPEQIFDAITVRDKYLYTFIGTNFWKSAIDFQSSKNGRIQIWKGVAQNTGSDFFGFKECQKITSESSQTSSQTQQNNATGNQVNHRENSVSSAVIILIVVSVMVVVIGFIIFSVVIFGVFSQKRPNKPMRHKKATTKVTGKPKVIELKT